MLSTLRSAARDLASSDPDLIRNTVVMAAALAVARADLEPSPDAAAAAAAALLRAFSSSNPPAARQAFVAMGCGGMVARAVERGLGDRASNLAVLFITTMMPGDGEMSGALNASMTLRLLDALGTTAQSDAAALAAAAPGGGSAVPSAGSAGPDVGSVLE